MKRGGQTFVVYHDFVGKFSAMLIGMGHSEYFSNENRRSQRTPIAWVKGRSMLQDQSTGTHGNINIQTTF